MKSVTWLDLRLMITRQPGIALLLAMLLLAAGWLLTQPSHTQRTETRGRFDSERLIAAHREFRKLLIPPERLAASQQAFLDAAANQNLRIGQVDYSAESEPAGRFSRVLMRLPVTGRYADIRIFLETAMADQPALSLRQLSIQRDTESDLTSTVTATLAAQFLVGEPPR